MSLRAVLVDVVGTLMSPAEPVGETYARTAARHGVRLPAWRVDDAFRRVLVRMPPMVFPGLSAEEVAGRERAWWSEVVRATFLATDSTVRFAEPDRLASELFDGFARPEAWRIEEGADSALARVRARGLRLGVASNFDHRLPLLLEALGLAELFDAVTRPGTCGFAKPDPAFFRAAADALGVAPHEALHVGDDPDADVAAARRAGLQAVGVDGLPGGRLAGLPAHLAALAGAQGTGSPARR